MVAMAARAQPPHIEWLAVVLVMGMETHPAVPSSVRDVAARFADLGSYKPPPFKCIADSSAGGFLCAHAAALSS